MDQTPPPAPPPPGWAPPPAGMAPPQGWAPAPPGWDPPPPGPGARRLNIGRIAAIAGIAVVVVLSLLFVVGVRDDPGSNGEHAKSADQVLRDAGTAYSNASSVHITGTSTVSGETDVFDLYLAPGGGAGSITANGTRADIVLAGGDVYLHGRAFWAKFAGSAAADFIGDRWAHFGADNPVFSKQFKIFTINGISGLLETMASGGGVSKGRSVHEDGVLAMPLDGGDGSLDVALDGAPYPVRLHYTDKTNTADLHFGDYDKPFTPPQRPPDVVDIPNGPTS